MRHWGLYIVKANNGYTLEGKFGNDELPSVTVIEETEDGIDYNMSLLWEVMEYFNFGGSKHDKERIRIIKEKQEV